MNQDLSEQIERIKAFLLKTVDDSGRKSVVIGVSGGIDSAIVLTLLTRALGRERVVPVLMPYSDQDMSDAQAVIGWLGFDKRAVIEVDIEPIVSGALESLKAPSLAAATELIKTSASSSQEVRQGNLRARARMMVLFDLAHRLEGLVCGTENKSEKYLGYFTRFGDSASDLEPISHLYKTQVRQLAIHLGVPENIRQKEPSAGLWAGQTDETELGFSYEVADQVMNQYVDEKLVDPAKIAELTGVEIAVVEKILTRIKANHFKQLTPFVL